jgi:DNA-binding winged helix-turn-helix (wHTH) protein
MMDRRSFPDDTASGGFGEALATPPTPMLRLVRRPAQRLGNSMVDPAGRTLTGPAGSATLEPRMAQVLLALADAAGAVVTRDRLIADCWAGQVVGDDSINRAIAGVRRAGREAGADFTIITVAKAGYRLSVPSPEAPVTARVVPRRQVLFAGMAGAAALTGWWAWDRDDPAVGALIANGRAALRDELPDDAAQGVGFLTEAVARAPDNAEAWGMLALALTNAAEYAPVSKIAAVVRRCETAARRALAIDPDQPDARGALVLIRPTFGDWLGSEQRLRSFLATAPASAPATAIAWSALAMLMQGVGRCGEAVRCSRRAVAIDPLSPVFQYRLAYQLWSTGRTGDADRAIDRALQLWPRHPAVWYARLVLFGTTGRVRPALAMLDEPDGTTRPQAFAMWRRALLALDDGGSRATEAAAAEVLAGAGRGSGGAVNAILLLAALGSAQDALNVAEGYLLRRGPLIGTLGYAPDQPRVNDQRWRKTMMLWLPVTDPVRALPGFEPLVRDLGMAAYWRAAGVRPDYLSRPMQGSTTS